jgi:glutamine cyclotransferase
MSFEFFRHFLKQYLQELLIPVVILACCCPLAIQAVIEQLMPVVVAKLPHELPAFTQGLAIEDDQLYESTGLYGQSSLRILDIATGKILRKLPLTNELFAEGIAVFPHQIVQLTWRERQAFVYERKTLKLKRILFYSGEGWGLCRDENTMWMSNGTSILVQRDLSTFAPLKTLQVHVQGTPVGNLNDLECVGNELYANIWQKNWIIRINKLTGEVTGIIDASSLLSVSEKARLHVDEVLNGIAFRPKTGTFLLTGKGWPWIFEVCILSVK